MAIEFFDKMAASISRTAKGVSDNAKVATEKNRLRKEVSAIESEIASRYRDIGQRYFEENAEHPLPEYEEQFTAIAGLKESLAAKQHEMDLLSGVMTCPSCGQEIPSDSKFCSHCGATMPEPPAPQAPEPEQSVCPVCGTVLSAEALFCPSCGTTVRRETEETQEPKPEAKQSVCPNCGQPLPEGALFCGSCGTKAPDVE